METLPAPPPGPTAPVAPPRPPRAGELTPGWLVVFTVGWVGVAVGLGAVWSASRQIGLSTWWLGPPSDARPVVVSLLPFVAPVLAIAAAVGRTRFLPWIGLAAAVATAAVGIGDLDRVPRLAALELVIAACGAAVSAACLAGRYRPAPVRPT